MYTNSFARARNCLLGTFALTLSFLVCDNAVAGCDLMTHLARLNPAKTALSQVAPSVSEEAHPWLGPEDHAITGYWLVVGTDSEGNVSDERFDNWFEDHNEMFVDQSPPPTGNACNGTWKQSGPQEFKLLHKAWVFDSTNTIVIATVAIRDSVTLSGRDAFSGTEIGTVYDLNNNVLGVFGPFELKGTRLKVDF